MNQMNYHKLFSLFILHSQSVIKLIPSNFRAAVVGIGEKARRNIFGNQRMLFKVCY